MHDRGKSDRLVVPAKPPNNPGGAGAEVVEGRGLPEGNVARETRPGLRAGLGVSSDLDRVRRVARKDKQVRFTALLHHVSLDRLRAAYWALEPKAAPGVDGVTWRDYGLELERNLEDLHARVHRGAYRARPARRVFIPKPDGRQRPLGVAALEDKLLQRAVVEVLNVVYEQDFLGFSYGFRPGRSPHDALDALATGITRKKVNWVIDADIRDFFGTLDQGWLEKFLEHRIADRRVLRLIQRWLKAGVIENGEWSKTEEGTAQGASISPLLANVYLHYVFDLWANQWRRRNACGDVILVRFADDYVAGFERREDAERFLADLRERFARFGLELHPDKTRLIEFGRFAARNRERRGDRKPETFDFLGFTHICARTRNERFKLKRVTNKKKMRAKLKSVKAEMMQRRDLPIPTQGRWLTSVLSGHYRYYAVPDNGQALRGFRTRVIRHWRRALSRRSQKDQMTWGQINRYAKQWLPEPRILHPWPDARFDARTQGKSPVS
jgi:RNA-directed DNA polymerase